MLGLVVQGGDFALTESEREATESCEQRET